MTSISDFNIPIQLSMDEWEFVCETKDETRCLVRFCLNERHRRNQFCAKHANANRRHGDPLFKWGKIVPSEPLFWKACRCCLEMSPIAEFPSRSALCRGCEYNRKRQDYLDNPERQREANRKYYYSNKDRFYENGKRWREDNRDKVRQSRHKRRAALSQAEAEFVEKAVLIEIHGTKCYFCEVEMTFEWGPNSRPNYATIEHLLPVSRGGSHTYDNLTLACFRCNSSKNDKTVDEFKEYLNATKENG